MTLGGSGRLDEAGGGVSRGDCARRHGSPLLSSISDSSWSARAAAARRGRISNKRCSSRPTSGRRETSSASFAAERAELAREARDTTSDRAERQRSQVAGLRTLARFDRGALAALGAGLLDRRLDRPRRADRRRAAVRTERSSESAAGVARHRASGSSGQLSLRRGADARRSTRWRASGLRFEQATTVVPLTLPAHSSLMTGTFPGWHGVRDNGGFYLGDDQLTLAEILRDKGFRTGGFVGSFVLDRRWGIAQGFDRYFDDFDLDRFANAAAMDMIQRPGSDVVDRALEWLQAEPRPPVLRLGPPVRRAHAVRSARTVSVALPANQRRRLRRRNRERRRAGRAPARRASRRRPPRRDPRRRGRRPWRDAR